MRSRLSSISLIHPCIHSPEDIFCFSSLNEYNAFWSDTIELDGIEYTGNFADPADIDALLSQAALMQHKYEELGKRCQSHPTG